MRTSQPMESVIPSNPYWASASLRPSSKDSGAKHDSRRSSLVSSMSALLIAAALCLFALPPTNVAADVPFVPLPDRPTECPPDAQFEDWADTLEDLADRAEAAQAAGDDALLASLCLEWFDFLAEIGDDATAARAGIEECKAAFAEFESCQLQQKLAEIAAARAEKERAEDDLGVLQDRKDGLAAEKLRLTRELSDRQSIEQVLHALELDLARTCARIDALRDTVIPDREREVALAEHNFQVACDAWNDADLAVLAATVFVVGALAVWSIALLSGNPIAIIIATVALAIAIANVIVAELLRQAAQEEKEFQERLLQIARQRLDDARRELESLERHKRDLEEIIKRLRDELANSRDPDVIAAEFQAVCDELDSVCEAIEALQERIAQLTALIAECEAQVPALEDALQEACDYFAENIPVNYNRFLDAQQRLGALWGL